MNEGPHACQTSRSGIPQGARARRAERRNVEGRKRLKAECQKPATERSRTDCNRKRKLFAFCFALFACTQPLISLAAEPELWMGTWKLIVEKSRYPFPSPPYKGMITMFRPDGDNCLYSFSDILGSKSEPLSRVEFRACMDGKDRASDEGTLAVRRVDPYTIEFIGKHADGTPRIFSRRVVMADGQNAMVFTVRYSNKGEPRDTIYTVFERVAPGTKP